MGFSGISIWQLLIIAVIIVLLFGTKKLRGLGSDLGSAVKGFRGAMQEGEQENDQSKPQQAQQTAQLNEKKDSEQASGRVIDAEATKDEKKV